MPDAETMKRLETVAFYLGAADHCRIDIETDRLEAYFIKYDGLEPVTWARLNGLCHGHSSAINPAALTADLLSGS
ncbi:MAG: hypothetical protein HPM95_12935 [Alphaproteobacteria bacterium]|nr:hypothetical protein [Alphaproteobacteria bacterium]